MAKSARSSGYTSWPRKKLVLKKCARGSLRPVMPPGRTDVRIIVCCPTGKWKARGKGPKGRPGRCTVPMKPHLEYKQRGRGSGWTKGKR